RLRPETAQRAGRRASASPRVLLAEALEAAGRGAAGAAALSAAALRSAALRGGAAAGAAAARRAGTCLRRAGLGRGPTAGARRRRSDALRAARYAAGRSTGAIRRPQVGQSVRSIGASWSHQSQKRRYSTAQGRFDVLGGMGRTWPTTSSGSLVSRST